jgi:hypothetical protein
MPANPESDREIAEALCDLLRPYADRVDVLRDDPADYLTVMREKQFRGKPVMFGAVRASKAYVSYHLFPLYACPGLAETMSPELRKRMQGKSCFNFRRVPEPALLDELRALTAEGFRRLRTQQLPE